MDSFVEKTYQLNDLMPLIREQLAAGKQVRFSPNGTSMLPMLRQGVDSVILSPLPPKLRRYDLPLYQRKNGQYVLHRIVKAGDRYVCMGDNQFDPEPDLERGQMIAVVTAFVRNGREYSVRWLPYRIYCRFWYHSRHLRRFWRRGLRWLRRVMK